MIRKLTSLGLALLLYSPIVFSNQRTTFNYSAGTGTPVTTTTTDTLDRGQWSFDQRIEYYRTNQLSDSKLLESANYESSSLFLINYLMLSYGLTDDLTWGATLPVQRNDNLRARSLPFAGLEPTVKRLGDISGFADSNAFGMWRIVREDDPKFPISTALLFGIEAPTGKTNARGSDGRLFASVDQPGSGAWEPFGGIIFSKKLGSVDFSTNLFYTHATKGAQDTTWGSYFDYDVAAVYELMTHEKKKTTYSIDAILELTGEYISKSRTAGIKDPDTGSNTVFLAPGARLNIGDNFSCYLGLGIPVVQTVNGVQVETQYAVYSGIDITF